MHLLVPFASDPSEACRHVLHDLALPHLAELLAVLEPTSRDEADDRTFSPPHERALAAAWGWRGDDGALPFAAQAAAADGIAVGTLAWGLFTPAHWQLGRDRVVLLDPAELGLGEGDSRALFATFRGLLESDGFEVAWGAADRWYGARADLAGLPTASLDRVVGRSVDDWLRHPSADASSTRRDAGAGLRRLQSEAQLLLHVDAVNEAREERGELAVNSFWLSGCGVAQAADETATPTVEARLRLPLLAGDWAAWAEAWQALDAGPLASAAAHARAGGATTLTLCGARTAARFERRPRSLWQRLAQPWRKSEPQALLAAL